MSVFVPTVQSRIWSLHTSRPAITNPATAPPPSILGFRVCALWQGNLDLQGLCEWDPGLPTRFRPLLTPGPCFGGWGLWGQGGPSREVGVGVEGPRAQPGAC